MSRFHGLLHGGIYNNEGGGGGGSRREKVREDAAGRHVYHLFQREGKHIVKVWREEGREGTWGRRGAGKRRYSSPHTERLRPHKEADIPARVLASLQISCSLDLYSSSPRLLSFPPSSSVSLLFFSFYTHCLQVSAPQARICPHISVLPALKG